LSLLPLLSLSLPSLFFQLLQYSASGLLIFESLGFWDLYNVADERRWWKTQVKRMNCKVL
ncbi:hypothetical protein LINPERHAP1_LOCUS31981, partial [Linum perenne]